MLKTFALYINDQNPSVAAAIRRERMHLRAEARVYVKSYTRGWPGGKEAAQKAIEKERERAKKMSKVAKFAVGAARHLKSA